MSVLRVFCCSRVLKEGLLLENESFYLAEKILEDFVAQRGLEKGEWIVLNGLPRHLGQAEALPRPVRDLCGD